METLARESTTLAAKLINVTSQAVLGSVKTFSLQLH